MAKVEQKLKTPRVPNYILVESPAGPKQLEIQSVCIADLPDETLEEIANDWRNDLFSRAKYLRKNPL